MHHFYLSWTYPPLISIKFSVRLQHTYNFPYDFSKAVCYIFSVYYTCLASPCIKDSKRMVYFFSVAHLPDPRRHIFPDWTIHPLKTNLARALRIGELCKT